MIFRFSGSVFFFFCLEAPKGVEKAAPLLVIKAFLLLAAME